jgi:hypothetical protein
VTAAGLEAEWDQKATAGLKTATNKSLPADTASIPTGSDVDNTVGNHCFNFNASCDIADWDTTGYNIQVASASTVILRRSISAYPTGGRVVTLYDTSTLHFYSCDVDCTGGNGAGHGSAAVPAGASWLLDDCHLWGPSRIYADSFGRIDLTDCYIEDWSIDSTAIDDHSESFKINQGIFNFTRSVIDANDGGTNLGLLTGVFFLNAENGNVTAYFKNSIIVMPTSWGMPYTIQSGVTSPFLADITFENCVIRKGTSDYITNNAGCTVHEVGNNYDFDTGAVITGLARSG